jgi:hypothetical protein
MNMFFHATITRTSSIKGLGVFSDAELQYHIHIDGIFSECMKPLGSLSRYSSLAG